MGLRSRRESSEKLSDDESDPLDEIQKGYFAPSQESSATTHGSVRSNTSDAFTERQQMLRRVKSERPELNSKRQSLLSLSESAQAAFSNKPGHAKSPSWCAGPTKSAKEGIAREWAKLQLSDNALLWQNEEGEMGNSRDPRELGRRLLFTQLEAQRPYWVVTDVEGIQEVGEMLVGRWIESGRVRRRMAEWEELVHKPKVDETMDTAAIVMPFHFARR